MATQLDIRIVMATYNGEPWLAEQLESLFSQNEGRWKLVVRDDGSTDATVKILQRWQEKHPEKITWYADNRRLGPARSFSELMVANQSADYLFFCDQDDVWTADKLARGLAALREMEQRFGTETPLLVHHDLTVCDRSLIPIADSFLKFQALDPAKNGLSRLLLQNVVTGCTTGINRALAQKAGAVPESAIMHDWWLALVATSFGQIRCLRDPGLIRYRIHGGNTCGTAERALSWSHIRRRLTQKGGPGLQAPLRPYYRQAQAFLERFQGELSLQQTELVQAFIALPHKSWLIRRWTILRYGFWKQRWIRNVAWLLRA